LLSARGPDRAGEVEQQVLRRHLAGCLHLEVRSAATWPHHLKERGNESTIARLLAAPAGALALVVGVAATAPAASASIKLDYLHISPNGNMYAFGRDQSYPISLGNISYQTIS
jgi:hypothetical protein